MLICFNCSSETKRQLDALVSRGGYADYGELISAAIANQSVLSERVEQHGELVLASGGDEHVVASAVGNGEATRPTGARTSFRFSGTKGSSVQVPALFALDGLEGVALDLATQPEDSWDASSPVPASRWLWGQFNRFLPAKASCRALAKLQLELGSGVSLAETAPRIAKAAAELGDYLVAYDRRFGLKRDDAAATAFPHGGPDPWKAQQRYAGQFVGSVNTEGVVSGMLVDLKLINWEGSGEALRVRLTEAGWQLAQMANPILDYRTSGPVPRLGEGETALLLKHIRQSVRPEDFAYRSLMEAIDSGADSPRALDDAVETANRSESPKMSRAFISTQRSGAIARMADLGLVARVRSGLTVTYATTERGRRYLSQA